ncbi:hypothetical protein [Pseudomaricurvus sp. HS19]|uniref:hypothetical protein n=1 Tax=Pseudomaricurvus sp. HS19 TaxID=2692626 RepID=UPI00136B91A6|nr:hypothetical protein [Pseudomaricurvus sp. HS19]MYM64083.1 hypothetical protein [Pseudomaricurvus sp. HS19]
MSGFARLTMIMLLLSLAASVIQAHECTAERDEFSLHFQSLPLVTAFELIAEYAGRELVVNSDRNPAVPLHYNCLVWQFIGLDLSEKHGVSIKITRDKIVVSDP